CAKFAGGGSTSLDYW
nr:immunoglobulin heavy chain junction region [Macaca mulatta]